MKARKRSVIFIDVVDKALRYEQVNNLGDCLKILGGTIECVYVLPNGDEVYVGCGQDQRADNFFYIKDADQPWPGNAIIVGPKTKTGANLNVRSTISDLKSMVDFRSPPWC